MTKRLLSVGGLSLLLMSVGAGRAGAQTTAVGPYYATPSWDQTFPCTALNTCPRFVVLANMNNQAVLDRETGLVWERSPGTGFPFFPANTTWSNGLELCRQLRVGTRAGWRLPTIEELSSLADSSNRLPVGHPFLNVHTDDFIAVYWSASRVADHPEFAYIQGFNGSTGSNALNNTNYYWCVRGGVGASAFK